MRRQELEIAKLETEARLRRAEAHRLELANEEKELQLILLRQKIRQGVNSGSANK